MQKPAITILFFISITIIAKAQRSFTVATGFSIDVGNNHNEQFNHIPVSFEWKPSLYHNTFFIKLDYDIPVSGDTIINAYTLIRHCLRKWLCRKIYTRISLPLSISWEIAYSDSGIESYPLYYSLSLLMPVPKSFSENDFLRFQGQRFPLDSTTNISIQLNGINYYTNGNYYYNANPLTGHAGIYFVSICAVPGDTTGLFSFSGLFDGSIGNNISITKGRFDFYINPSQINY